MKTKEIRNIDIASIRDFINYGSIAELARRKNKNCATVRDFVIRQHANLLLELGQENDRQVALKASSCKAILKDSEYSLVMCNAYERKLEAQGRLIDSETPTGHYCFNDGSVVRYGDKRYLPANNHVSTLYFIGELPNLERNYAFSDGNNDLHSFNEIEIGAILYESQIDAYEYLRDQNVLKKTLIERQISKISK